MLQELQAPLGLQALQAPLARLVPKARQAQQAWAQRVPQGLLVPLARLAPRVPQAPLAQALHTLAQSQIPPPFPATPAATLGRLVMPM